MKSGNWKVVPALSALGTLQPCLLPTPMPAAASIVRAPSAPGEFS